MLKNGLYNSIGGLVRVATVTLSTPILVRLMGLESYGLWVLVSSALGFISIAEAGLPTSTTVFVSQDLSKQDRHSLSQTLTTSFCGIVILASIVSLLLWTNAAFIVHFFPSINLQQRQIVIQALQFGSIAIWAQLVQQICIGVEQAYQQYKLMSALKTLPWVFFTMGWILIARSGGNAIALAQWQAAISILTLLGHFWLLHSLVKTQFVGLIWNRDRGLAIIRYSLVAWVAMLGGALFTRCDRLIIGAFLGASKLGIYSVISDFSSAINFFSAQPIQPILPTISYLTADERTDKQVLQRKIREATHVNCFIATGVGATLVTLAPIIVRVVLPEGDAETNVIAFQSLMVITTLFALNGVGYFILFSQSVTKLSILQLLAGSLSILLITLGSKLFGLLGAVLGNGGYLLTLLMPILALRQLNLSTELMLRWVVFPTSWFIMVSLVSMGAAKHQALLICLLLSQLLGNCVWLALIYRSYYGQKLSQVINRLIRLAK